MIEVLSRSVAPLSVCVCSNVRTRSRMNGISFPLPEENMIDELGQVLNQNKEALNFNQNQHESIKSDIVIRQ